MNRTKRWWQSKGVWGAIIAAVAVVGGQVFNLQINDADMKEAAVLVESGVALFGAILALIGRVKANSRIERV